MRWFPVAFLTNGDFIVTRAGFEPTTSTLGVSLPIHYTTTPPDDLKNDKFAKG